MNLVDSNMVLPRTSFVAEAELIVQRPQGFLKQIGAVAATAVLAVSSGVFTQDLLTGVAHAETPAPSVLSDRANNIVVNTVNAWKVHQLPDGNFMDPSGKSIGGYGVPMIGQAMVETGVANGDEALQTAGIKAEVLAANQSIGGGFETFSLAGSLLRNQDLLANDSFWQASKGSIASVVQNRTSFITGGDRVCYDSSTCWTNLKLVAAFAKIEQGAILNPERATSSSKAHTANLPSDAAKLLQDAAHQTGADASRVGSAMQFDQAGILSDPSRNPLAYHELSAMVMGRSIEAVGPSNVPAKVRAAFMRSAKAIVGLMAPDGDVAYIGRGQGQVWNVAAAADALAIAAKNTPDPVWRGRFLAGVGRTLDRLQTVYTPDSWGMPLVPRLSNNSVTDYLGIDDYANTVEYNGLALWGLSDVVSQLRQTTSAPQETIGADVDGTFIDPSHTKFASVRRGNTWFAVHASDTHTDARYDFGVVAAERNYNGRWLPALPYRPLTNHMSSAGPVLLSRGEQFVPSGESIMADAQGVVKVRGGWSSQPNSKATVSPNTTWTFRPQPNGVSMAFLAKADQSYQFTAWYPEGSQVVKLNNGIRVTEPSGRRESYTTNVPVQITQASELDHSAYDLNLSSSKITIHTNAAKTITYNTNF